MKITIGSDHAGFEYKSEIINFLENNCGAQVLDVGTHSKESVDYPEFAHLVSEEVILGADFGILICGSGNGVSMAANKHKKIRAAVCYSVKNTKLSRLHNNANIITLGSRLTKKDTAFKCIEAFINTKFEGGRHKKRVLKI